MYTRRVARLRVSHSRRRCVQPLRASRNARDSHSRDAWAFKSSRWTHRQLPFRRDSPRRGETNRTGISLGNSEFVYPCVYPSRTCHELSLFATTISDFGRRDFASRELRRSRRRAFLSVPSVSRSHTTAPRQSPRRTARERGARTGERVRAAGARGAREARQGVRVGGTRPGGPEIRREPGTSWLRSRRSRGVPLGFS